VWQVKAKYPALRHEDYLKEIRYMDRALLKRKKERKKEKEKKFCLK
jgi:hypothetical protein